MTVEDTNPEASARYQQLLHEAGPARRLSIALRLMASSRALSLAGIRRDYPHTSTAQVRALFAERLYGGAEIARKHFSHGT
jgi:hypothetical protein